MYRWQLDNSRKDPAPRVTMASYAGENPANRAPEPDLAELPDMTKCGISDADEDLLRQIAVPDPSHSDEFSDVTLMVEGRKLYTSKAILAAASPAWQQMFLSGFIIFNEAKEIPLPGKTFEDVRELLLCIAPGFPKHITADNVWRILPLADEYQMWRLANDCEKCLLQQTYVGMWSPQEELNVLVTAQNFNLHHLLERCISRVAQLSLSDMRQPQEYGLIHPDNLVRILEERVEALEEVLNAKDESESAHNTAFDIVM